MAKLQISYAVVPLAFLIFFLLATSSSLHDREFQILDASSPIKLTRDVFSPKSRVAQVFKPSMQQFNLANNHSTFFLTLHPRESLPFAESHNNNYTALTLSRLARDEAHVRSRFSSCSRHPHSRHSHARSRRSRAPSRQSGGRAKQSHDKRSHSAAHRNVTQCQQKLQSPVISGVRLGSGEYFARIGLGRPAREFYMVLDTGSDLTWIQCLPCISCYRQVDPIFNPSASSTYRPIPCNSPQCTGLGIYGCRSSGGGGGRCLYQISYGDGSFTVGNSAKDTFSFGTTGSVPNVTFGCGHVNEGLFSGSAGLLGIGNGALSLTSQIKATSFSYCLVDRDMSSYSTLEFNPVPPADSVFAPMIINPKARTYFYVDLTGITIGGRPVSFPPSTFKIRANGFGGVIVDSGTAISRFHPEVYAILRDTFRSMTLHLPPAAPLILFDTCYNLSSMRSVRVPTLSFLFANGETLSLRPRNYLIPVGSDGRFCFAFSETTGPTAIIGNVQQQGTRVTYDLVNRQIGFSQNKC